MSFGVLPGLAEGASLRTRLRVTINSSTEAPSTAWGHSIEAVASLVQSAPVSCQATRRFLEGMKSPHVQEDGTMADEYELSPDERLCHDVMDAISRSEPIRASSLDGIRVKATNETVELKGIIASEALSYVAEQLARTVPGVKAVVNHLATNEGLERHVAMALASDESTRHQRVAVRVVEGAVFLYGAVASQVE